MSSGCCWTGPDRVGCADHPGAARQRVARQGRLAGPGEGWLYAASTHTRLVVLFVSETGSETDNETGNETGSETGSEAGSETGSETDTQTGHESVNV